ncbi:tyrosine-type recombinase/integrase [Microcoleus sp. S13_B4]|uniref:tyrosine-type recombinase/integrase n=1 Tax=Microcoleus sp. S13_B4 TaxID=3055408 RepID=UPI003B1BEB1E
MRHADASHSLDKGAPLHLVQATLGHTSISATSVYLHVHPMDSTCRFIMAKNGIALPLRAACAPI